MKKILAMAAALLLAVCPCVLAEEAGTQTGEALYTFEEGGVSFTVPEGWTEDPLSQTREIIRAKFLRAGKAGAAFCFGYADYWASLSEADRKLYEQQGVTREKIGNAFLPAKDIAAAYGLAEKDVRTAVGGGQAFYVFEIEMTDNSLGTEIRMLCTIACCISSRESAAEAKQPRQKLRPAATSSNEKARTSKRISHPSRRYVYPISSYHRFILCQSASCQNFSCIFLLC